MDVRRIEIAGRAVRLEPLDERHVPALFDAAQDDDVWRWMPNPRPRASADMAAWVRDALEQESRGEALPFALVDPVAGRAVGSTRFFDLRRAHRGLEIGWTWIGRAHQRTALNTEAKLLLLRHAFTRLDALRVQLKTDLLNERSQRAIERLGATREGVLRAQMVMWDGRVRDTVMYSVLASEWPAVERRLLDLLARRD